VCQDYGNGYYNALQYLAQEQIDYVVHLGDYIYETIAAPSFQNNPVRTVPPFPSGGAIPQDVDDYRHLYKVYRGDLNQQAVHERFTYIQLWDDHEFANDCHQDFHPDNNTAPNSATTQQPAQRQAANQAWSEYGLADTPFDPSQDWESSIQVYRSFSFGSLAELIVTDERLYRDGPPCGNNQAFQRYFSVGCSEMGDASRSMLGITQREWFMNKLSTTPSTWKLWANEVMLMQLKLGPIYVDLDQWDGYQQERNLILNAVKNGNIKNLVALTGDLHTFLAGYLKTDFDNPFEPHVGIELMVGSITSANFAEEIESALPLSSRPLPAKDMGVAPNLLDPVIRAANPWIQYWDSSTHGYGILTITKNQLVCQFKAVSTITQSQAALVPLRTLTIPAGRVQLNQS
jgi:alkaline phosphatase D